MNPPLTEQQQRAIDEAQETPARIALPEFQGLQVLLPSQDFEWIRNLLPDLADVPRRIDPRSQAIYAVVPLHVYERFQAFFEDDPITPQERQQLLRDFGLRAGWDDPEMDVYEEYRNQP